MNFEGRLPRSLRHALVGLANGASLIFLAVLVAAYGSGTGVPFTSADGFLRVATTWAFGVREPSLAWALGYLGIALLVLSPVWFLVVSPLARGVLDFEFSTAAIERREESAGTDQTEGEVRPTKIDETGTRFVRGGGVSGGARKFTFEDASGGEQAEHGNKGG